MTIRAPQIFRRSSAVILCALAGLVLTACGGGGESGADGSRLDTTVPFSEKSSTDTDNSKTDQAASGDDGGDEGTDTDPTTDDDDHEVTDSGSTGDDSNSGDEGTGSKAQGGEGDDSLADSDELVSVDDGAVTLEWYRPQYRENGELIQDGEIGGYEVRYRQVGAQQAQSVVLDGEWELEYELELEEGQYEFSIAAYDVNGLYSEFVSISPLP